MSLYADWGNDWALPYPFRLIEVSSNSDAMLGQWACTVALFGLSLTVTWEYAETPLKADLRAMMADDSWLENSRVFIPHADYKALRDKADAYDKMQAGGQ